MKYSRIDIIEEAVQYRIEAFNPDLATAPSPVVNEMVDEVKINGAEVRVETKMVLLETGTTALTIETDVTNGDKVVNIGTVNTGVR